MNWLQPIMTLAIFKFPITLSNIERNSLLTISRTDTGHCHLVCEL